MSNQLSETEVAFRWEGLSSWLEKGLDFWWFDRNCTFHSFIIRLSFVSFVVILVYLISVTGDSPRIA